MSAHNTWLDIVGDLGVIGLILFVSIFVIALVGFVRPRWLQTRELSMTLFVMMLPVLSGSFFLPLLNNKLGWALIGPVGVAAGARRSRPAGAGSRAHWVPRAPTRRPVTRGRPTSHPRRAVEDDVEPIDRRCRGAPVSVPRHPARRSGSRSSWPAGTCACRADSG